MEKFKEQIEQVILIRQRREQFSVGYCNICQSFYHTEPL